MAEMYSMRKTMSVITDLYIILKKNREQIEILTAENEEIQKRIEELATNYDGESSSDEECDTSVPEPGKCRAPSGFVRPGKISDELAEFLGKEKGTMMARTDITREIQKYIRNNGLQDQENKRNINPDEKLLALFNIPYGEQLTYFNLQRYIGPHCLK